MHLLIILLNFFALFNDINVNFTTSSDFDKLVKQSNEIMKAAKEAEKAYKAAGKGNANLDKAAKEQAKLAREAEKARQAEEKRAQQLKINNGLMGSAIAKQKELGNAVKSARTPEEFARAASELSKVNGKVAALRNQIKGAGHDTRGWMDALNSFQFKFNFLGNALASGMAMLTTGMKDFAISSVKAFMEAERADKKLLVSLKGNEAALQRMTEAAQAFQKRGVFDDDAIKAQMAFLAATGKSEKQILKIMEASMAWARQTGKELAPAVMDVNKAFAGNLTMLGRIDPAILKLTKEQRANGEAVDYLINQYGHLVDAISIEDKLKQTENAWGDLKESFGSFAAVILSEALPAMTAYFEDLNEMIGGTRVAIDALFSKQTQFTATQNRNQIILAKMLKMTHEQRLEYFQKELTDYTKEQKMDLIRQLNKQIEIEKLKARNRAKQESVQIQEEENKVDIKGNEIKAETLKILRMESIDYKDNKEKELRLARELFDLYKEFYGYVIPQAGEFQKRNEEVTSSIEIQQRTLWNNLKTFVDIAKTGDFREAAKAAFGINDEQLSSIKENFGQITDAYNEFIDAKIEKSKQDVENSTARIGELQQTLQAEIQLNQSGFASNIQLRLDQIAAEEEIRKQAVEQQKKYQRQQALIDSAMTVASTATAVANTFKVWSGVPFVGPILAAVQVGAMLLQIAAAKQKAQSLAKYEKGGKLHGPRHSGGGVVVEGEGGEWVINRDSSDVYDNTLKAINDKKSPEAVLNGFRRDVKKSASSDRDVLLKMLEKMPDKHQKTVTIENGCRVERFGNTTRIYSKVI